MAELTPIDIRIDEKALREQVRKILGEEIKQFSQKLRWAADVLDPEWVDGFEKFQKEQIDKAYQRGLAERDS